MTRFGPVAFITAQLQPNERHLHSFDATLCEWMQPHLFFFEWGDEVPQVIEGAGLLGHATDRRLILEPQKMGGLRMLLSRLSPKLLEHVFKNVPGIGLIGNLVDTSLDGQKQINEMAENIGFYSLNYEDIGSWGLSGGIIWPIMKKYPGIREPVFVVYDINGDWPRGDELIKLISKLM